MKLENAAKEYMKYKKELDRVNMDLRKLENKHDKLSEEIKKYAGIMMDYCGLMIPEKFIVIDGGVIIVTESKVRVASEILEVD